MKIAISTESTADLSQKLIDQYHIFTIPFTVRLGDREEKDGIITPEVIYNYVDETGILPKTSSVNEFEYESYFKKIKKEYDAIIHISLSEKLSASINQARLAAERIKDVYIIDSMSLSTGIGLLAIYAAKLVEKGYELEDIVNRINKRIPHVQASFVVNSLNYLYKGGRCTGLQKFGAMLLRLKPQIILKNGAMVPGKSYKGKTINCVESYCKDTLDEFNHGDKELVFVTHSGISEDIIELAKDWLIDKGFTNIEVTVAGATISSHCGPKTIGILYINDDGLGAY